MAVNFHTGQTVPDHASVNEKVMAEGGKSPADSLKEDHTLDDGDTPTVKFTYKGDYEYKVEQTWAFFGLLPAYRFSR